MLTDNEVKSGRKESRMDPVFCLEQLEEYISHYYRLGRHQEEPFQTESPFRKEDQTHDLGCFNCEDQLTSKRLRPHFPYREMEITILD